MKKPKEFMELVNFLDKGGMLSQPLIKQHVDYALATGDSGPLYDFLEARSLEWFERVNRE